MQRRMVGVALGVCLLPGRAEPWRCHAAQGPARCGLHRTKRCRRIGLRGITPASRHGRPTLVGPRTDDGFQRCAPTDPHCGSASAASRAGHRHREAVQTLNCQELVALIWRWAESAAGRPSEQWSRHLGGSCHPWKGRTPKFGRTWPFVNVSQAWSNPAQHWSNTTQHWSNPAHGRSTTCHTSVELGTNLAAPAPQLVEPRWSTPPQLGRAQPHEGRPERRVGRTAPLLGGTDAKSGRPTDRPA